MHRCMVRKLCSHMVEGGLAHPIAFGSQTLPLFFIVKLLHQYHNGRAFTWMTDTSPTNHYSISRYGQLRLLPEFNVRRQPLLPESVPLRISLGQNNARQTLLEDYPFWLHYRALLHQLRLRRQRSCTVTGGQRYPDRNKIWQRTFKLVR